MHSVAFYMHTANAMMPSFSNLISRVGVNHQSFNNAFQLMILLLAV